MKRPAPATRTTLPLTSSLHKNLNAYAVSAAAAGVAVFAAVSPLAAEVVYTPADQKITGHTPLNLDLNNDGVIDFKLLNFAHFSTTPFGEDLDIVAAIQENGFVGATLKHFNYEAAALRSGIEVGPKQKFLARNANMAYASLTAETYVSGGPWKNVTNGFLGLKFLINGEIHYGWARLTVLTDARKQEVNATLTGYAYETVPNKPIKTGQTSDQDADVSAHSKPSAKATPLGLLALGSVGMGAWRREETN